MSYIEHAVTVAELTEVTKRTTTQVEVDCRELGFYIGENWAGRPAVTEADAAALVSGRARHTRQDETEWAEHLADCAAWTAQRDELVRAAQRGAVLAAHQGGRGGGAGETAGVEAARAVGGRYEVDTPRPTFRGQETGNAVLAYTGEDDRRGLLRRAAAAIGVG